MSPARQSGRPLRTYVVLCVDDHAPGLTIRKALLESFGYTVYTASSGAEALRAAEGSRPDAVVLDYRMPEMDGLDLARELSSRFPALPLIVLSGYSQDLPAELKSLASVCIAKGSAPAALREALERILGPANTTPSPRGVARAVRLEAQRARENVARTKALVEEGQKTAERSAQVISRSRARRRA